MKKLNRQFQLKTDFHDVGMFQEKFGMDNCTFHAPGPRPEDKELIDFREKFMNEELYEFAVAREQGDIVRMFDALLDLVYVAEGTAHFLGLPWDEGWAEVQRANMKKRRATSVEESQASTGRGSAFDVVKPEGWTPPDLAKILRRYGFTIKE